MYVCMYVCTYVCMYLRMFACMYVCMYVRMYACMHVCMHVCMYAACMLMYVCMCMCMCIYIYIDIYTHILELSDFGSKLLQAPGETGEMHPKPMNPEPFFSQDHSSRRLESSICPHVGHARARAREGAMSRGLRKRDGTSTVAGRSLVMAYE